VELQMNTGQLNKKTPWALLLIVLALALAVPSYALAWPVDSEWFPLTKSGGVFFDPAGDAAGSRDIVGSDTTVAGSCTAASCPSAYIFNDGTYLHFRLRLNADPRGGGGLAPFGWGLLIDTNGVLTDYEWMIMVNGIANPDQIEIDRNVLQGAIDSPSDKAEVVSWSETAVENSNYRVPVADSTFGGNADYFLDFRIPYATFKFVTGITDATPIRLYIGSSNNAQVLSADLGDPSLSLGWSDTLLPTGTKPSTGSIMVVADLAGAGDVTQIYVNDTIYLRVIDQDRNTSSATLQTVTATITVPSGDSETVTLTETGVNTGVFTGALATQIGAPAPGNGTLQAAPTEIATATYVDAIDAALNLNQNRTDTLTVLPAADLAIAKTASTTTPSEGATVVFTVTVTNNGPSSASGIQVTDLLPAGVTYVSDNGGGTYNPATGIWWVSPLANGVSASLQITVTVNAGTNGATITNTASITASAQADPNSGNNSASRSLSVGGADLGLSKIVSTTTPTNGSSITYTVTLVNNGGNNATGVVVTDLLPAGVAFVSATPSQGAYVSGTGLWTVGALANGATATLTITATVTAANGTTVVNTATITAADQADGNSGNNTAGATIVVFGADLAVTKTVSNLTPNEGTNVIFTIVLRNNGSNSATGTVTDVLPAGLTYVTFTVTQGTWVWTPATSTGVWSAVGPLNTGNTATLTITANVNAGTNGTTITNTASITASNRADPVTSNNTASASITVRRADVGVTKTVDNASPNENTNIVYTVTVTNYGPDPVSGVVVSDVIPTDLTYQSNNGGASASYNAGNRTLTWNVPGTIAVGGSASLQITCRVNAGTALRTIVNTATRTAPAGDPNSANDSGSVTVIVQGYDLVVTKAVNNSAPAENTSVVYTVTITNNGPFAGTGITVNDVLPAGTTYQSYTSTQGNYNNTSGLWTVGNLANGASATLNITALVNAGTTGQTIVNPASNSSAYDYNLANNTATATIYVGGTDLAIGKTVSTTSPNAGDTIVYTVTARNLGPNPAGAFTVLDVLASGQTFSASSATAGAYDSGTGQWTLPSLATGATATLTITLTVNAGTGGSTINNTASLSAFSGVDINAANNSASTSLTVQSADVFVTKTADNLTPTEFDPVVYTVTVSNNGPSNASGVNVSDLLPAGVTYLSHVVSQGTYSATIGVWNAGPVAKLVPQTLQITARVNNGTAGTNITNTASVSSANQEDPAPANNSANITITPVARPMPNIVMVKSAQIVSDPYNGGVNPKAIPGAVMLYTITLTNQGTGSGDAVVLTDPIPLNTTLFVNDIGGVGSGPVLFTDGAIPSGLTYSFLGLGNGGDSLSFSNNNGATYAYTPVPDGNGFDSNVTNIRIAPSGALNGAVGANQPSFTVNFRVKVN
jgi:uncharacterized repeat protein (TIGR01451 family)